MHDPEDLDFWGDGDKRNGSHDRIICNSLLKEYRVINLS